MVDERHPPSVRELGDDLVAQDGARVLRQELLDVRSAEPARDDAYELARPRRLRDIRERRLPVRPHDDRAHRRSLGRSRGSC
jgi:hypothetical protein